MTFEEARQRGEEYLARCNVPMQDLDSRIRSLLPPTLVEEVWEKQAYMMRDYILGLLCEVYAGLLKDQEYAFGWLEEVINTGDLERRAPYRQ